MKARLILPAVFVLSASLALAQDAPPQQPDGGQGNSGYGQRRGMGPGNVVAMGRGVMGTVTQVAADHYVVRNATGETYTVQFSVNTRFFKGGGRRGRRSDDGSAPTPPESIKSTDIKVGDAIAAIGQTDESAKSIGAVFISLIDPERARQMAEMQANYGKTWFMGRVTAIQDLKVTVEGGPERTAQTFTADENTAFRKRREPATLADIQVGDMVRVQGALKSGAFVATQVDIMGGRGGRMRGEGPQDGNGPPPPPQQ